MIPPYVGDFPGNTADPKALTSIVTQVRKRFGITNVVFVGDRGMITTKRINEDLRDVDDIEGAQAKLPGSAEGLGNADS